MRPALNALPPYQRAIERVVRGLAAGNLCEVRAARARLTWHHKHLWQHVHTWDQFVARARQSGLAGFENRRARRYRAEHPPTPSPGTLSPS